MQDQYKDKNEKRLIEYNDQVQKLKEEREYYQNENKNRKREHAELLQKLSEERNHYQRENVCQKTEQEKLVATELKSMRKEVRVEIDTMRATITKLLQRQSHHSESPPKNDH